MIIGTNSVELQQLFDVCPQSSLLFARGPKHAGVKEDAEKLRSTFLTELHEGIRNPHEAASGVLTGPANVGGMQLSYKLLGEAIQLVCQANTLLLHFVELLSHFGTVLLFRLVQM